MEYYIQIHDQYLLVCFKKDTVLSPDLIREVLTEQRKEKGHLVLNDVWDTRGCIPDRRLNSESIARIVDYIKELHAPGQYHQKSALIVDSELAYGVSRIYQTLTEELPFETQIFRDNQEAQAWILS